MGGSFHDQKGCICQSHRPTPCATEMYLSHGEPEDFSPHQPDAVYPTLVTASLSILPSTLLVSNPMAYFSNNDTNFYPTSYTFGEFEEYPFLSQTLATEGANAQAYHALADHWSMAERSGSMVGLSTSLQATANQPVAPATPYLTQIDGYGQPLYSGYQWPAVGHQAESYHSGFLSRDTPFADTVALEVSTVVPTYSSFPFNYWGDNQNGESNSTFYEVNG
ncbi:hypothetical protein BDM02DRAFT_1734586 [Thelephora ganbajun]|uniref:Uncharacterized protein n=1 Tax=Thelephora ganbajun TaxID=370292 RepID=A0ACB6ZKB8_THEGA|nr:hypothetical protein BDM02DRAFT_1734586 [Thelephora ganbajun]